ncbi:MAG: class II aldolase/adducin family protein [Chloroflexota bacterium]|nr:class II aldolase/adducin family protein [Chloroflexota bacterium]
MSNNEILSQLVAMTREIGNPVNDYAILGEGNTSARADDQSFWIKGSGREMRTIDEDGFIQIDFEKTMGMLDGPDLTDAEVKAALTDAKVDPEAPGHPSTETGLHAICLELPGVEFVGHFHASAINMITCSTAFEQAFQGRLFPDEIVLCGVAPVLVPYTDPGLPLAREVQRRIYAYIDDYGERPKLIHIQNHGTFVLGDTAQNVLNIAAMAVKTARILVGTYALGGPNFMTPEAVARIHTRPDEHFRQAVIGQAVIGDSGA